MSTKVSTKSKSHRKRKGVLYVIINKHYPDFIKIGKSYNFTQRLHVYNTGSPMPCIDVKYISLEMEDSLVAEQELIKHLGEPSYKQEWYPVELLDKAIIKIMSME
jgi:hypothetical protein